jgi:hypothetical protein
VKIQVLPILPPGRAVETIGLCLIEPGFPGLGDRRAASDRGMSAAVDLALTVNSADGPTVLFGAKAIAQWLTQYLGTEITHKKVYDWVAAGHLPANKLAGHIITTDTAIKAAALGPFG